MFFTLIILLEYRLVKDYFGTLLTFVFYRQEMMAAQKEGGKKSSGPAMDARKEMSKTKEQVDIRLSINSHPLAPRWRRR